MTNVCFAGVTGWTAAPILAAIDAAPDLVLTSGVSRSSAGQLLDSSARMIWIFERLGWATGVRWPRADRLAARRA